MTPSPSQTKHGNLGAPTVVLCIVIACLIAVRVENVLPMLNYYRPGEPRLPTPPSFSSRYVYQRLTIRSVAPGFSLKNSGVRYQMYMPADDQMKALAGAVVHPPSSEGFGDFTVDWDDPETRFFDENGKPIPRPPRSEMPYFGMRAAIVNAYLISSPGRVTGSFNSWGTHSEFWRISNTHSANLVEIDADVHVPDNQVAFAGTCVNANWNVADTLDSARANAGSSSLPCDSLPTFGCCWDDPHSKFYGREGDLRDKPPASFSGSFRMTPHLTLLYDKTTGKFAGGYWWGEFHDASVVVNVP